MDEYVYVTTRISKQMKDSFQKSLDEDGRQYTVSQILRMWIERFIETNADGGQSAYEDLRIENEELKQELRTQKYLVTEYYNLIREALYERKQSGG